MNNRVHKKIYDELIILTNDIQRRKKELSDLKGKKTGSIDNLNETINKEDEKINDLISDLYGLSQKDKEIIKM